jgi:hypothetical protein
MKKLLWVLILVFFASIGGNVRGQSSPAFDPDVYLPKFGDGIDTIQGHDTSGFFGSGIINLGPGPGEPYGRIAMQGMPGNAANLTTVHTGHDFDLHKLKAIKQLNLTFNGFPYLHWGHLHSTRLLDLVVCDDNHHPSIYWGDSLGNFDSTRVTRVQRPGSLASRLLFGGKTLPYVTYLTSDSLEDLVCIAEVIDDAVKTDSFFMYLYEGGESLFTRRNRPDPDSAYYLGPVLYGDNHQVRNFSQGDWRGVGRDDLIGIERYPEKPVPSTWYFYRNELPFSMENFARAMFFDTLFLARENSRYTGSGSFGEGCFSMAALPKASGDNSADFMPTMGGIYIFRGGPDFGSKHLFMDSAEAVITNPADIDPSMKGLDGFGDGILNCGDVTGTGNLMINTTGSILKDNLDFFYVLGKATDNKVDMYVLSTGGETGDSLTSDPDNREDILTGNFTYSRLELIHGTSKIPVKLNPKYSVTEHARLAETPLYIYPNPATTRSTLTFETKRPDDVAIIIRDILGREVFREERKLSAGILQIPLTVKSLMNGTYIVQVKGKTISLNARLEIVR